MEATDVYRLRIDGLYCPTVMQKTQINSLLHKKRGRLPVVTNPQNRPYFYSAWPHGQTYEPHPNKVGHR